MHPRSLRTFITGWLAAVLLAGLAVPAAFAQTNDGGLSRTYRVATGEEPPKTELTQTVGLLINSMLVLLGFVFLMLIVWGGIHWMTAGGNEEKVTKAKTMIMAAIAGMVVVFISYALADAIVDALAVASGTG